MRADKIPYNDELDGSDQLDAEEAIAAHLFHSLREKDETDMDEETAAQFGRDILYIVLRRFRPDFF